MRDGKTNVVKEAAIGDELVGGPVSVGNIEECSKNMTLAEIKYQCR